MSAKLVLLERSISSSEEVFLQRERVEPEVKFKRCWTMMNEVDISFV